MVRMPRETGSRTWAPVAMPCEAASTAHPVVRSEYLLVALDECRQFHTGLRFSPDPVTANQLPSA